MAYKQNKQCRACKWFELRSKWMSKWPSSLCVFFSISSQSALVPVTFEEQNKRVTIHISLPLSFPICCKNFLFPNPLFSSLPPLFMSVQCPSVCPSISFTYSLSVLPLILNSIFVWFELHLAQQWHYWKELQHFVCCNFDSSILAVTRLIFKATHCSNFVAAYWFFIPWWKDYNIIQLLQKI